MDGVLPLLVPEPWHPATLLLAAALAFLAATYAGYPGAIALLARLNPAPARRNAVLPPVTCIVASHDEGERLVAKVRNLLALDYPAERLDVVVADDGSADGSPERARQVAPDRVQVVTNPRRAGKPSAIVLASRVARGEVLLLCDVRQRFDPGAARALVAPLSDPGVGAVTGQLLLDGSRGPGAYWRYESAIRRAEGRFDSVVGATGAIYAIRRDRFPTDLPPETILDDVYVPMRVVLSGLRVVPAPDALAYDVELDVAREFRRKVRTLAGNYQLLRLLPELLDPSRNRLFWQVLWHKLARLACPWALVVAFAASAVAPGPLASASCALQLGAYALALAGHLRGARAGRLAAFCHAFVALNAAAVVGLWRYARGAELVTWQPTAQTQTQAHAAHPRP